MKYNTQNKKITSITEKTLIVGIDVGSQVHYARAFDWRNFEYSKKEFAFSNDEEGFMAFKNWMDEIAQKHHKNTVMPGMEPTGHYWFSLGAFLQNIGMRVVHVNPHHVKKSKELDDNNSNKNDRKDPKTIAALVNEGRFSYPYIPTGIYAEIRNLDAVSGMMILKEAPLPDDIVRLGAEGINRIWREAKLRAVGMKRAKTLVNKAEHSVGSHEAPEAARVELRILLNDYEMYNLRMEELMG